MYRLIAFILMKKYILLTSCLFLLIIGIIGISCKKEDSKDNGSSKKWKGCSCTVKYYDGDSETDEFSAEDIKDEFGSSVKSCKDLEKAFKEEDDDIKSITCKDL